MRQRLREFDSIRAFATLSVIAIHLTASYVTSSRIGFVWNETMRYSVPVFIILSGLVLMYADIGRTPLSYLAFQRKRLGKILLPYLIWTVWYVYYTARQVWRTEGWPGAKRIADTLPDHFWAGDGAYHLYFLLIICQLYLLYPLLRFWLKKSPLSLVAVSFGLTMYGQTMAYLNKPAWAYDSFANWIFYFVLGMFLITKRTWLEQKLSRKNLLLCGVWLASLALLIWDSRHSHMKYTSIKPAVVLYSLTSFLFFYTLAYRFRDKSGAITNAIDWISTHSFFIFLVHPLILNLLYLFSDKHAKTLWDGTSGMVLLYVCTVLLTAAATWAVSRLPLCTWVGAVQVRKNKGRGETVSSGAELNG